MWKTSCFYPEIMEVNISNDILLCGLLCFGGIICSWYTNSRITISILTVYIRNWRRTSSTTQGYSTVLLFNSIQIYFSTSKILFNNACDNCNRNPEPKNTVFNVQCQLYIVIGLAYLDLMLGLKCFRCCTRTVGCPSISVEVVNFIPQA